MRKSLLVVFVLALVPTIFAQRLPETAIPSHYQLRFTPNFTNDTFGGDETIDVRVLKPTTSITLNAAEITFEDVTITAGGVSQKAKVTPNEDTEMATLTVEKPIPAGPAKIAIRYQGILNNKLRGLYLSKTATRKYAVTQFEATDARRAFPSFDEPAYKASFDITAVVDSGDTAISNGKIVSEKPGPEGKKTIQFATTPKMSTYLVALAVGDWKCVSDQVEGIPLRVCAVPGKEQMGHFALDATKAILSYYNKYYGIKYPFGKLDQIAAPDFEAGAMENTGAIIYRETLLLADDKTASEGQRRGIAGVIAHEIAHQWFGDLVTMKWWDDVWLNEGFASWMTMKPLQAWKPEWHMEQEDVLETNGTLNIDSTVNTRPIHQDAQTKGEINALFDGIAYGKTSSVLRMLESYLGEETFRAGVNRYLSQHAYGNATAADFWSAMAAASKKPVDQIMPTFVNQAGVPYLDATAKCAGNNTQVSFSQKRFFVDPKLFAQSSNEVWQVPVCMKGLSADGKAAATRCDLVTQKQQTVTLPGCSSVVFPNAGGVGYYRFSFNNSALNGVDVSKSLTPNERIMFVGDEWALVRAGNQSVPQYLSMINSLRGERNEMVLEEIANRMGYIGRNLVTQQDKPEFQTFVRNYFQPILREVGMTGKPGEPKSTKELRSLLFGMLGTYGEDPQVIAQSKQLTQEFLQNPASVDPEISGVALAVAAEHGDAALYDQLMAKLKQAKSPQEYYRYFFALGQFRDPALLQRTLDFALTPEVRNQDLHIIAMIMGSPEGQQLAFDFVRSHWDDIMKKAGGSIGAAGTAFGNIGSFCDPKLRDESVEFYNQHKIQGTERNFKQAQEAINYCIDMKQRQGSELAQWLQQHAQPASPQGAK